MSDPNTSSLAAQIEKNLAKLAAFSEMYHSSPLYEARRPKEDKAVEIEIDPEANLAKIAAFSEWYHSSVFYEKTIDPPTRDLNARVDTQTHCKSEPGSFERSPGLHPQVQKISTARRARRKRRYGSRKKDSKFALNLKSRLERCPEWSRRIALLESIDREGFDLQKKLKFSELFYTGQRTSEFKEEIRAERLTPEELTRVFNSTLLTTEEEIEYRKNGKAFSTKHSRAYRAALLALRLFYTHTAEANARRIETCRLNAENARRDKVRYWERNGYPGSILCRPAGRPRSPFS
jgi:hypothetical protein